VHHVCLQWEGLTLPDKIALAIQLGSNEVNSKTKVTEADAILKVLIPEELKK
jgi:hypothetical protein